MLRHVGCCGAYTKQGVGWIASHSIAAACPKRSGCWASVNDLNRLALAGAATYQCWWNFFQGTSVFRACPCLGMPS